MTYKYNFIQRILIAMKYIFVEKKQEKENKTIEKHLERNRRKYPC